MHLNNFKLIFSTTTLLSLSLLTTEGFAAKPIDLKHAQGELVQKFFTSASNLKQVSSNTDINGTTHLRIQQMYSGFPVWGADFVAHIPRGLNIKSVKDLQALTIQNNVTYNGIIYEGLQTELDTVPNVILSDAYVNKTLQTVTQLYQKKTGSKKSISDAKAALIVFVDKNNVSHWAYKVSFTSTDKNDFPVKPIYIVDASTFTLYKMWNNLQTLEDTQGGGLGGNPKSGKISYDNLSKNPSLNMMRDPSLHDCYLENADVTVKDARTKNEISHFNCLKPSAQHNNIYWDADFDTVNGAYSPSNDALYDGKIIKDMYQKWYGIPVLVKNGKPMMLNMVVHANMENAYWDGSDMTFGDGGSMFYPLVSLGVGAHEISHGFTEQHSNLVYDGQSGGLNESFSDMAAQAAEYYSTGKSSWQIGAEIMKANNQSLRYMDEPTKDCEADEQPGGECSISNVKDYGEYVDVHYSSGIFNKAFYLLATSDGWNTKKAFDVMVQANTNYWTSHTSFAEAACGVVKAAQDYKYPITSIKQAMLTVGIKIDKC